MKHEVKKMALGAMSSDACTGMYAGKGVTTDGSVLIGRTVDFSPYNATMYQQVCEAGAQELFGGRVNRYRYVCTPKATSLYAGRYAGGGVNEKGVELAARTDEVRVGMVLGVEAKSEAAKFLVKADGSSVMKRKGDLTTREMKGIQAYIRKHYLAMYAK